MKNTVMENWKKIIEKLKVDNQIPEVSYKTWIKPLEIIKVEDNVIYLDISLKAQKEFVTEKYLQPLKVCIAEVMKHEYDVKWIADIV